MTTVKKRKPAKSKTRKTTTKKRKTTAKRKVAKKPAKRKRTTAIDGVKAKKTGIKKVIKTLKSTLAELEKKVG